MPRFIKRVRLQRHMLKPDLAIPNGPHDEERTFSKELSAWQSDATGA